MIIIDEISMVSNYLLLHLNQRLIEIFGCSEQMPFAGISVIACGDFYQLPPIQQRPVYSDFSDPMLNLSHNWKNFKLAELTEVMRQRGDQKLIDLLNNIRIGKVTDEDEITLKSRIICRDNPEYPLDALHIWAENIPVSEHNTYMLNNIEENQEFEISAVDTFPKNITQSMTNEIYSRTQMNTNGLAHKLTLKLNAKVMITTNVDVSDKLNNGQIGTVNNFKFDQQGNIMIVYLKMEDNKAGMRLICSDIYGRQNNVVPIQRVEKDIKINKNSPSSPVVKRLQFPLMLSWACTVHKVQGKSFSKIAVSFDLVKQKSFKPGQIYVALSRVTTLNGLYLTGIFDRKHIRADKRATEQYDHMYIHEMILWSMLLNPRDGKRDI